MFICRDLQLQTSDVTVLRTRVSHAWLGQCILHVSCEQAAEWLRTDQWPELETIYVEYEGDARSLADKLGDLNASILVRELKVLRALPENIRATLRSKLETESREQWNPEPVRLDYLRALSPLLEAVAAFRAKSEDYRTNSEAAMISWSAIRSCALRLKEVLQSVPAGVVLP